MKQINEGFPQLITIEEFSKIFKVSKPTIHNWVNKGLINRYKLGRRTYFKAQEVQKTLMKSIYHAQL